MDKIILGMDPGTNLMGYGVIHAKNNQVDLIQYGVIHLKKYATHELKLKKIFDRVLSIIDEFNPDEVAIEAPFYGKNIQSMLKLGRAQGVAMAAVLYRNIAIKEYAPKKVKQSVTGNGNASKEQVAKMFDATDALAVALCHFYQEKVGAPGKKSWKSFISDNPDRIIN